MFKRILVGVDGSPAATRAARQAAELAVGLGAELTLAHVYNSKEIGALNLVSDERTVLEIEHAAQRAAFDSAVQAVAGLPIVPTKISATGGPAERLTGIAMEGTFDLVVVGTRGRPPVTAALLGSVSEALVRDAPCPVMIVR